MSTSVSNKSRGLLIIASVIVISILVISQVPPIYQDAAFHNFADSNPIGGIPNLSNVVSNFGFIIVGLIGLLKVVRGKSLFGLKITFGVLFTSVFLIGIGSAYYHLHPDNDRLVFDRIPMTCVFMSFLSIAIILAIDKTWGLILFVPLVCIGIFSVLWWHYTEINSVGDLRLYGLVQFLPMLLVPLIFKLFPSQETRKLWPQFIWIIGWYILAKLLERFDLEILRFTHSISGHSLKHIVASIATIYFIFIFKQVKQLP